MNRTYTVGQDARHHQVIRDACTVRIEYHFDCHMSTDHRGSSRPASLDRLVEASADAAAASVYGLQQLGARRRTFSLKRSASDAVGKTARYVLTRILPAKQPSQRNRPLGPRLLHLLVVGGVPATSTLARVVFMGTVRAAPVVWKVSRDRRAQSAAAVLVRIMFGHRRRPSR
jgi:hypothetical protein